MSFYFSLYPFCTRKSVLMAATVVMMFMVMAAAVVVMFMVVTAAIVMMFMFIIGIFIGKHKTV